MIDFKEKLVDLISQEINDLNVEEIEHLIEIPPQPEMGDYALPCFKFAGIFKKAPNIIAEEIASKIEGNSYFSKVVNTGPYVNFFINKEIFAETVLEEILQKGKYYGARNIGKGKNVIVEFSSPNIAKPFHIGHIRTTVIGHALRNIYNFLGYNAIAINHLGDYGTQFGKLIVALNKWGDKDKIKSNPIPEFLKLYIKFHEEAEKNPELEEKARSWFNRLENKDEEAMDLWKWIRNMSLKEFKRVYDMLGIDFDSYAGESFYSDMMPDVIEEMEEKGLLQESQGAKIVDLEEYNMPPAMIEKSDGSTLYITRDIAAAIYRKKTYNFYKNIYVVGSQQKLHFDQWFKIIELMGHEWARDCIHVPFGMVSLEDGTMSTRKGRVVFLEDVLNKAIEKTKETIEDKNPDLENKEEVAKIVGIGAVIFQELYNSRIKDYVFSWDRTLSFEGETGPYVQYTYVRTKSVLNKSNYKFKKLDDYSLLTDEDAFNVIKLISQFPDTIIKASERYEPSIITRHITELAKAFNKYYHDNQILVDDQKVREARLFLVYAVNTVLKTGLSLLGIKTPEKM
ncbi:arginine--tRNA ligase [Halothermothrix orenii]|uniref:Arginine--tRNA ligase n=1 Tax=Halothermothrix orenii (strain H 168 / OCM 544 / DSM 9562) TaxID=373903 RepID=SYR_HALOH|nr:arginine--tRNA ligase [Halothermothrix orenii]B8CWA9.1 RecName: Full=Arginine--tRNA ligase; AltName: Full=Arginyl-tRNA synthetase; Short=ArgRS [Halothermothrix orenii H 168]ACL69578.1 arginyl-tRNA synthetase [Halothermothrix orenii H 168]